MSTPRFKIIVPSYQSADWLPKTLQSIESQTYTNYEVCVIDDASPDPRQREVIDLYTKRNGWLPVYNEKRLWAMVNVINGIQLLECEDQDVIVVIDGDDWLFNENVLTLLADVYRDPEVWVSCSQFIRFDSGKIGRNRAVPNWVVRKQRYRQHDWLYNQLRTFRYWLWKKIRDEDLRGPDGEYFKLAYDAAVIYPMVEMAGKHQRFIPEVLYVYNDSHPLNDHHVAPRAQKATGSFIQSKPPYKPLRVGL